jgi:spoIIIJ-associated protein
MEWVETTGRTVAEALDAALDELGVDEDEVEYEVMEQPRTGLLARFSGGGARIRARVKPISREKPGERQRRNSRGGGSGQGRSSSDRPSRSRSGNGGSGGGGRAGADEKSAGAGSAPQGQSRSRPEGAQPSKSGAPRRRSRRSGTGARGGTPERPASAGSAAVSDESTPDSKTKGNAVEMMEPEVTIEEQAEAAEAFTQGLVDAFDLGAQVRSVIVDEGVVVDVTGESLGLLVGPRGATLNAIEELVRTVVQRQTDGHGVRINVDVAGYRAKRREALEEFTRGIAQKVLESGRPQALEPMSALDRKVVHDAAAEIDGVATESQGEEPRRRVVLIPDSAGDAS